MPSLRVLTAGLVALTLVPGGILAWLGWQATEQFGEQLRRAADEDARRIAAEAATVLAERDRHRRRALHDLLGDRATALTDALLHPPAGTALRAATRGIEAAFPGLEGACALTVRRADGTALLPCADLPGPPVHLPEWSRYRRRRQQADTLATRDPVAAAEGLLADATRLHTPILAWRARTHAGNLLHRHAPERAAGIARSLTDAPGPVLVRVGPALVEAVRRAPGGRAWLRGQHTSGWLDHVPCPPRERLRWCRAADLPGRHSLRATRAADPSAFVLLQAPLPAGATLELAVSRTAWAAALLPATWSGARITTAPTAGPAHPPRLTGPAEARAVVGLADGSWSLTSTLAGGAARAATARRQRWATGIGIALLLLLMGSGLVLVRRVLASERRARRLRDDFIANVSHDLKTPLTSLRMHAEMLTEDGLDPDTRRRYGQVVDAEGARLSALVEDLLDFAALEQGRRRLEPSPVDLAAAVRAVVRGWRPAAEREGVDLAVTGADREAPALVDPTALSRILANLLHNALVHGRPEGGGIPRVRLVVTPGPSVQVRDNGPGVPPGDRDRIFARFERGEGSTRRRGTGLGLALSRSLARAMGGDLTCRDEDGATVFELTVPPVPATDRAATDGRP